MGYARISFTIYKDFHLAGGLNGMKKHMPSFILGYAFVITLVIPFIAVRDMAGAAPHTSHVTPFILSPHSHMATLTLGPEVS